MPTNTLTSLAILKVNIDQGKDYLDYLSPFVLQILVDNDLGQFTHKDVALLIRKHFGLEIPARTIEIVLKRISKRHPIKAAYGVYQRTGELPNPQISRKQSDAERHIGAVLHGLRQYSQGTISPLNSDERAIVAICTFLAEFDITCLRAYLRGTAIPSPIGSNATDIVLVSKYIQEISQAEPERFESLIVLVQGHMLANALTCPDLQNAPKSYQNVNFYLDTPLLVRCLGAEGEAKQNATMELNDLLNRLGGRVATFSHCRQELQSVLQGAAAYLESPGGRGQIIYEARKRGATRSDLLLLVESIDEKLSEANIQVEQTPRYIEEFQINETIFEQVLDEELFYNNPRAKEFDINSVRSIYVIRGELVAPSVEKARAVFVTSNGAFAQAAWEYGQQHESSQDVSSVITDFSLANMAWLKAPMGAPKIPTTQLLAFSYAALEPSKELLAKYIEEVDKLEKQEKISERDHQLLRSSHLVYPELIHLTLGEDSVLTEDTISQTLERVSSEIRKEESDKLLSEKTAHQSTQGELDVARVRNQKIISNLYWRSFDRARLTAVMITGCLVILLAFGSLYGLGLRSTIPLVSWTLIGCVVLLTFFALSNLILGSTVKNMYARLQNWCLTWLLKRAAKTIGAELAEFGVEVSEEGGPSRHVVK